MHERAWKLLANLFHADVAFPRKVVLRGINPIVDLFPQPLQLAKVNDATGDFPQQPDKIVLLARATEGQELADAIKRELDIAAIAAMRLWIKVRLIVLVLFWVVAIWLLGAQPSESEEPLQVDPAQSLDELAANDDVTVLFAEVQRADGSWPYTVAAAASIFPPPVKDLVAWRAAIKVGGLLFVFGFVVCWWFIVVARASERGLPRRARQRDEVV